MLCRCENIDTEVKGGIANNDDVPIAELVRRTMLEQEVQLVNFYLNCKIYWSVSQSVRILFLHFQSSGEIYDLELGCPTEDTYAGDLERRMCEDLVIHRQDIETCEIESDNEGDNNYDEGGDSSGK